MYVCVRAGVTSVLWQVFNVCVLQFGVCRLTCARARRRGRRRARRRCCAWRRRARCSLRQRSRSPTSATSLASTPSSTTAGCSVCIHHPLSTTHHNSQCDDVVLLVLWLVDRKSVHSLYTTIYRYLIVLLVASPPFEFLAQTNGNSALWEMLIYIIM